MKFKVNMPRNPDGYGAYLVQKFAKSIIFRAILPYLVVVNETPALNYSHIMSAILFTSPAPIVKIMSPGDAIFLISSAISESLGT